MTRLIDADELLKKIDDTVKTVIGNGHKEHITGLMFSRCFTEHAPTVDAVQHGKWMRTGRTNIYGGIELECSECGDRVMVQHIEDELFCRHCGARMDGGKDET